MVPQYGLGQYRFGSVQIGSGLWCVASSWLQGFSSVPRLQSSEVGSHLKSNFRIRSGVINGGSWLQQIIANVFGLIFFGLTVLWYLYFVVVLFSRFSYSDQFLADIESDSFSSRTLR